MNLDLITPNIGLVFWMTVVFLVLFFALKKFAWPSVLSILKEREEAIENALTAAEKAREEIKNLNADNEKLLREARIQSEEILRSADEMRKQTIGKAQNEAQKEYERIIENARLAVENEKKAAIAELQNEVAKLSIDIAEKILREELKNKQNYNALIEKSIKEVNLHHS
ncbi:MAG: F0F1 ATP synthase subunit B [Bacteroidales bacterium]|nr:F0F1 ATP synthase subunit B [Bacteroidales bacterium]